ncbi:MAG TPA: peptidoglycan-binding protein [Streptosporangiaceae bacterium]
MTADRRLGWRRGLLAGGCVLVLGGAAGGLALTLAGRPAAAAGGQARLTTARVVRTGLVNTVQVSGALGYAGSVTVVNQTVGTAYTALPRPGQVVRRGGRLYEVDGSPVRLFYGGRPEWRALAIGVIAGPDVAQLDRNLIALGYASPATLTVSDAYTAATAYAVARWQDAAGLPVTGTVPLGQVVYAPGALRVLTVPAGPGAPATAGGTVLTATSDRAVVTAQLPVSQEYLVRRGDRVTVTLPNGTTTTPGVVTSVSSVASSGNGSAAANASPGPSSGPAGDGSSSGGGSGSSDTVPVTVRLDHPRLAGHLDQAPVTVNIVSAQAQNVLAVPVNALVALAGGGYAVQVVQGRFTHLTAVHTGLFGSTLVQVSGTGLHPGVLVEVPAP